MTWRSLLAAFAFTSIAFSQTLPSYQLIQELDASSLDTVAGLGTDAQGNVYISGTTYSTHFPVKNAVQPNIASAGLYRVTGAAPVPLGLSSCSALALDPQNPSTMYAVSTGTLLKSVNGGVSFSPTSFLSSHAVSIAIQPGNDQVLFAGTYDQGVFRSTDGGKTWTAVNNGLPVQNDGAIGVRNLWIDPSNVNVIFANTSGGAARTADGGANWRLIAPLNGISTLSFDPANAGVLYLTGSQSGQFVQLKSTDYGQTFASSPLMRGIDHVVADPIQPGRLIGVGIGLYESTDGGITFTQKSNPGIFLNDLLADTTNGIYYAAAGNSGIFRVSADLQNVTLFGPLLATGGLAVVNGQLYEFNNGSADVFVTKLDPLGNVLYSTYLGGTGNDQVAAMTVDKAGNVFLTGTTSSGDFPVSKGAYATSGSAFLTRLNPDGSLGFSTYFNGTKPVAVATDGNGSAWLLGNSGGGLPVTPGALGPTFCCPPSGVIFIGPPIISQQATLTRFSPSGSTLTFSTYVAGSGTTSGLGVVVPAGALAVTADGTAYVGGFTGVFRIDSAGATLLSSITSVGVNVLAMTLAPDGTIYVAGMPSNFQSTPGAFQTTLPSSPNHFGGIFSEAGIVRIDPALKNVLAATYFGLDAQVRSMTTDGAGNLYIGGSTGSIGLPTRTPFAGGFATPTGFMSELSGNLSSLLFSSYFGDNESFTVSGVGLGLNGTVWIGGQTTSCSCSPPGPGNVWVNNLALTPPPPLRIDSVENAASLLDGGIAAGETIVVNGAGFGADSQLTIGGAPVASISITPTTITATVPAGVPAVAAAVAVQSGGASTNSVLMPVAATAPGIFSQDGTGFGRGYILNKDGTLNSPSHPAAVGDPITIFATGVGPLSFTDCCAAAQFPVNIFIDGIYCFGAYAVVGHVNGLPGSVYEITVYVPNPAVLFPNLKPPFIFPPLDPVVMEVNGVRSQPGISISIAQ